MVADGFLDLELLLAAVERMREFSLMARDEMDIFELLRRLLCGLLWTLRSPL